MASVVILDQGTSGHSSGGLTLDILAERITVRELIRARIYQEVQDYNRRQPEYFHGLIKPTEAQTNLTGCRMEKKREIDWHVQFEQACAAFTRQQVLVLVADRQVSSLDEEIVLHPRTEVIFLRLVPLAGG